MLATSGLRLGEVSTLAKSDIEFDSRRVVPHNAHQTNVTKRALYSFFNSECESVLTQYLQSRKDSSPHLFIPLQLNGYSQENGYLDRSSIQTVFRQASEKSGVKLTPQSLRDFFCEEMSERGLPERYVDFFCGRTPKSVLARHYSDYKPEKMRARYEKIGLTALS